jgi:hypothetical protein
MESSDLYHPSWCGREEPSETVEFARAKDTFERYEIKEKP